MKNIILAVLVAMVGFMAGCATFPKDDIKVEAQADPKVNFGGYKSYAWLGSLNVLSDPEGQWKPPKFDADAELVYLVNEAMRKRGMSEVSDNPDLLVAYAAGVDMAALKVKENPDTKIKTLENVPGGALVVLLVDAQTEFVAWAGIATGDVKGLDEKQAKQRLQYVVETMFDKLPK